jgi:hypothetical protein
MNLMPPFPQELQNAMDEAYERSDVAYERCVQKEMDSLFDQADEMDLARWHQADLEAERLEILEQALDECAARGVSRENLKTLARETGATSWALKQSLKGA